MNMNGYLYSKLLISIYVGIIQRRFLIKRNLIIFTYRKNSLLGGKLNLSCGVHAAWAHVKFHFAIETCVTPFPILPKQQLPLLYTL